MDREISILYYKITNFVVLVLPEDLFMFCQLSRIFVGSRPQWIVDSKVLILGLTSVHKWGLRNW